MLSPPPYRPTSVGADAEPGEAGVDDDDDFPGTGTPPNPPPNLPPQARVPGIDNATEIGWPGTDDEEAARLKAIQITVRFVDPQTSLVRQVTFIESLVD